MPATVKKKISIVVFIKAFSCILPQTTQINRVIFTCGKNNTSVVQAIFDKNYVKNKY